MLYAAGPDTVNVRPDHGEEGNVYTNEGVRPLWRSGGKPLSQLSDEELTAAIDYVQAQETGDVALLKALRALRDERVAATEGAAEEQDEPPLITCW